MRAQAARAPPAPPRRRGAAGPAADLVPVGVSGALKRYLKDRKRAWQQGAPSAAGASTSSGGPDLAKSPEPKPPWVASSLPGLSPASPAASTLESPVKRRRTLVFGNTPPATPLPQQRSPAKLSKEYALTPLFHPDELKSPLSKTPSRDLSSSSGKTEEAEVSLVLSLEQSEPDTLSDDGFGAWFDNRVQREGKAAADSPGPSLVAMRTKMAKLKRQLAQVTAERDAAVQENMMLRGDKLSECTDLELHDLGQFLEEASTHLHAERRRRNFNRRMRQRSGQPLSEQG